MIAYQRVMITSILINNPILVSVWDIHIVLCIDESADLCRHLHLYLLGYQE